ncbi:tubulin polyglutamylase TTLL4-like isoform X2 [Centruroides sculpturatus]|uniref:tubulin polyglutamylase TTLL4-like isoform X1 n=1 Tax=Centruroides sculpturatus TaxID=218467 RepID=UPI000C6DF981|nr:tubulin polyglutamylase TTLL4-like isoform X1 [Centruroides sculpturatus]XP_023210126.1 tubulin polyglutamylase TTLL4-like isoform X1 [Centruroides sculpturatus]XP_023210127.1 tubulin polyglutamylase TTLL4-like isoform X1 [Centruroides sculpturatus]XP_023210128.1 tubulin polyglutamylase TTLL4-like isoform X2 [Centruroides sculpturatus]
MHSLENSQNENSCSSANLEEECNSPNQSETSNSQNETCCSSANLEDDFKSPNLQIEISKSVCSETVTITEAIQSNNENKFCNLEEDEIEKENVPNLENTLNEEFHALSIENENTPTPLQEDISPAKTPITVEEKRKSKSKRKPPLKASLFYNVPPTTYFGTSSERIFPLPRKVRSSLLWKLSTITPKLITQTISRSGFRLTEDIRWIATWGKHMRCNEFRFIRNTQKINHFPGSFNLGRKDHLWLNIVRMQCIHNEEEFSFMPDTYVLPEDLIKLRQVWREENKILWIVKPPASARGIGVDVIYKWAHVPKTHPAVVQKYISRPFLINGNKFDLRIYVLVTSFDPLRIYVFKEGLVRFASVQYSRSVRYIGEKFRHLTNYSINRKNSSYKVSEDKNLFEGHKWSLKCLWDYLKTRDINTEQLWSSIIDIVIKTLLSAYDPISKLIKYYIKSRYCCYELFGFDIIFDEKLKPWLLEVNISPSLHSNSQLDIDVKSQLIKDMFNTVGFQIPDDINITSETEQEVLQMCNITPKETTRLCINHHLHHSHLSHEERVKHIRFEQNWCEESILKDLTGDDVRRLIESEDELSRCGHFIRVFPSEISSSYLKYFEKPKYYNLLLDAWEKRFQNDRKSGIDFLQMMCEVGIHLHPGRNLEEKKVITYSKSPLSTINKKSNKNSILLSRV